MRYDAFALKFRNDAMARMLLHGPRMSNPTAKPLSEAFFEHHLRAVAARLERHTDEALRRQRDAWREALHRQAVLDERDLDDFREER